MVNIQISILNESTVLGDSEVRAAIPALQQQISRDFAPAWGIDADLSFIPKGSQPSDAAWWLVVLDNSDQAGALGYHDLTPNALPMGKVFAGTDLQYGSKWTVTASHELLEMLGDPDINLSASVANADGSLRLYAYEVADACEADQFAYEIGKISVSDFVYPAWFESFRQPNSTQFDRQKQITAPFQLLPGGYISILDTSSSSGWTQLTAQQLPPNYELRARVGSRRERRRQPRSHWLKSCLRCPRPTPAKTLLKAPFQTYRNPVYSMLQSALHKAIRRRSPGTARLSADHPAMQQLHLAVRNRIKGTTMARQVPSKTAALAPGASAAMTVDSASVPLTCAEMYAEMGWAEITGNTARRDQLANEIKFSQCDPLWAESVTSYLAWQASAKAIPYVPYKNLSDFVIDLPQPQGADGRLVIGVIGDWGTGMTEAAWLLGRMLNQPLDLLIHLGDIYYSGTVSEVADNFTNLIHDAGVATPVYSLAGNHDMYSGGIGYYGLLQQLNQPASYFCLRNSAWQILGLDTGYHDSDVFSVNTNLTSLDPNEEQWHLDKIANAGGRRTILMSHHQLFSPFGDGVGQDPGSKKGLVTNPNLLKSFNAVLANLALWLWGHEHSCNLFQPYGGLAKGRCIGASAVPEVDPTAYTQNANLDCAAAGSFPSLIQDAGRQPIQLTRTSDGAYYHSYAILRLGPAGTNSVAEYYQIDSASQGQESLLYSETL